jgi:hypothetical protein
MVDKWAGGITGSVLLRDNEPAADLCAELMRGLSTLPISSVNVDSEPIEDGEDVVGNE